jgi:L-galactose dehydrogenase/L-glyceraldehyde 3-phosphate reductase
MKRKRLGRTGLEISEIVLGGGYVGGVFLHADDDTRRAVLRTAVDGGINWIDTAPSYGDGQSEQAFGWLLAELEANVRPQVSTKVAIDDAGGDLLGQMRDSLERSFRRLKLDHIPLLQLHNKLGNGPERLSVDRVLGKGGVADAFDTLKSEGAIDHCGFTALGDPAACTTIVDSGRVDTAQVYFNLINPSAGVDVAKQWHSNDYRGLLGRCQAMDVGVLGIRVYAAGLLASRYRHGREIPVAESASYEEERPRADTIAEVMKDVPGTSAQKALRFVLDHPHVDAAVIGLAELDHLVQALVATAMAPLPDAVGKELERIWQSNYGAAV